jgi:hypothetical protein
VSGHDDLWGWFGLSYASFLTLPRVLMHEMPDEWQGKMAGLLKEWDAAHPNFPDLTFSVSTRGTDGRMLRMPGWLKAYRRPNDAEIAKCKSPKEPS